MIIDKLKTVLKENKDNPNRFFVRSALKEALQDYILNFVYNNREYKSLIFTGGTCLRKVYGLPRLSEDLDFDFTGKLEIANFAESVKTYFIKELQYKDIATRISGNGQTVFLKFPVLAELGLAKNSGDPTVLFVRCDFSFDKIGAFTTEVNSISTREFTFFALSYDLSTLFANKITAFVKRSFLKGKKQTVSFKGRDLFDLIWFLEKSKRSDRVLKPNWERLTRGLDTKSKEEIKKMVIEKVAKIDKQDVYADLLPFIESGEVLKNFCSNFSRLIQENVGKVLVGNFGR